MIWKVDRLARRTIDFLNADATLRERGAGIVAVEDPIDMTTAQGRAFATMLAVFAELEAAGIAARVAAARTHLIKKGRVVGGTVPYGFKSVENPDGPGMILRQDPERIGWVKGMADRFRRGDTLYMVCQWLDAEGAPLPKTSQKNRKSAGWNYNTVDRLLRNPVLAGATPFNPGNKSRTRGDDILRDEETGLPVVDPSVAIMSLAEWRAMQEQLKNRDSPQAKPRAMKTETSGLLSGLMWCVDGGEKHAEPVRMWRGTTQGRQGYQCRKCYQTISNFEDELIEHFLLMKGDWVRWTKVTQVEQSGYAELPEINELIRELQAKLNDTRDREERKRLMAELDRQYDARDRKEAEAPVMVDVWNPSDDYFASLWEAAGDDVTERRAVLQDALERIEVKRGARGRRKAGASLERLDIRWKRPSELGPRPLEV